jgi:hypothetical protein
MPTTEDGLAVRRVSYFGNWMRVVADFAPDAHSTVLLPIHLKG